MGFAVKMEKSKHESLGYTKIDAEITDSPTHHTKNLTVGEFSSSNRFAIVSEELKLNPDSRTLRSVSSNELQRNRTRGTEQADEAENTTAITTWDTGGEGIHRVDGAHGRSSGGPKNKTT